MKKYQLKERALMLVIYAMMKEGFRMIDIEPIKIDISKFEDSLDMSLISAYKKINRLNKTFANEKISIFLDTKLRQIYDNLNQECQPLYIGLLVLYFYINIDTKKDLIITDLNKEQIKQIFKEHNKEFGISSCTIKKAIEVFNVVYKDEQGYITFLETTNRFPFNLKDMK